MNLKQASRLGRILKIIGTQPGIKLAALIEELPTHGIRVSRKTITNDIQLLKEAFGLLPNEERLKSGYMLSEIPTIGKAEMDTVIDALNAFSTNLKDEAAEQVIQRIERILKTSAFKGTSRIGLNQAQIYRYNADQEEFVRMLAEASEKHQPVQIRYRSPRGEEQTFLAYPLWKLFHERGWYYVNRKFNEDSFFSWRLDRITYCEIMTDLPENMQHTENVKTAKYLIKNGWGMSFPANTRDLLGSNLVSISVRFNASAAGFIKEGTDRHPRASIIDCKEHPGAVYFNIKLPKHCHSEFRNWIRSWGAKAQFISPQSFVDRERAELREMISRYEVSSEVLSDEVVNNNPNSSAG